MEEQKEEKAAASKEEKMTEINEMMRDVNYTYVNTTGFTATNWDVRIGFGDRLPSGRIDPKFGIIMSYEHARIFLKIMSATIDKTKAQLGQVKDDDLIKSSD